MFSRLPPLRRFRLRSYEFGPLAFSTLRERLFNNLKVLDMARNYKFTSRMALDVMEECVHLEDFRMFCVDADELRDPVRPWVCLGLKRLEGLWAVAAEGSNALVFEALSRLTCLEYLDFGLDKGILMDILYIYLQGSTFLRWSVDEGLQHLATLKRLATVLLLNTTQDMDVEDIEWTAENLPALKQLQGTFSDDDDTNEQLKQIVKEIEQDTEQLANNINLIQLNPTIKELEVTMSDIHLWGEFWKTIDTILDKPKRLCVERVYFKGDALDSFWKACAQFEEVSFGEWVRALEEKTWPDLEDLSLEGLPGHPTELDVIFSRLPPLRRLRLDTGEFGPLVFNTLRQCLFTDIRVLDMKKQYEFTSRMALDVMEECAQL
ncbi:hypothetical protein BGX29_000124 [Mortierella sp. GBA35]|nr:hypothetical protein BGX29_000124 [Mortierella sp. GBA35]